MAHRIRTWRPNWRAAALAAAVPAAAVALVVALGPAGGRRALLDQARVQAEADPPRYDLALAYLRAYDQAHPDDPEATALKAEILAASARSTADALEAIVLGEKALRLVPDGPRAQEIRRRLVGLHLGLPPAVRRSASAEAMALALVARGGGPSDRRLLARVLEAAGEAGDASAAARAVASYEAARVDDPGDVDAAERLAGLYARRLRPPDPSRAVAVLDELLAANPSAGAHLACHRHYARRAADARGTDAEAPALDRAAEALRRALELDPHGVDTLLAAAEEALRRGDAAGALRLAQEIPEADRDALRVRLVLGLIDLGSDRADDAIAGWRQALLATGGTDAHLTFNLAFVLLSLGRVDEAGPLLSQFRRLTGGAEPVASARFLEGVRELRSNRPLRAIATLERALPGLVRETDGPSAGLAPQLFLALGQAYEGIRDETTALQQYRRAVRAAPDWSAPRLAIARLLEADRPDEALATLRAARGALPGDPTVRLALARAERARRIGPTGAGALARGEDLEREAEAIARESPGLPGAALLRADLQADAGRGDEAAALLAEAVALTPASDELWVSYAMALARLGRLDDALGTLDRAAAPGAAGDGASIRIARARLLTALGHGRAARDTLVRDDDRLTPSQRPAVWEELGRLHLQGRDLDGARRAFRRVADLRPDDPMIRLQLVELAMTGGDTEAVRRDIAKLKQMGGTSNLFWRVARVQELLREDPVAVSDDDDARAGREGRLEEAERLIDEIEAQAPRRRYGYLLRGLLLERRGRQDDAIAAYERALDHDGGPVAAHRLSVLYARQGRLADVERLGGRRGVGPPAEATAPALVELIRAGDPRGVEALVASLLDGDPDDFDARLLAAKALTTIGQADRAEQVLRDQVARRRGEPGPWLALLIFQAGQGQPRERLRATIDQIKAGLVASGDADLLWAQCYRIAGLDDEAATAYDAALRRRQGDVQVARGAAAFFRSIGRHDRALAVLRDARSQHPADAAVARALAVTLAETAGDPSAWEEAWTLVRGPGEGDVGASEDRLARALVLANAPGGARLGDAVALLEGLVADLPADRPAAATARALLLQAYPRLGRPEAARALLAADAADGTDAVAIALHAEALLRDGRIDEAERQCERLASAAPSELMTIKLRALILGARGRPDEAADLLETAYRARAATAAGEATGREVLALLGGLQGEPPLPGRWEVAERVGRDVARRWPAASWMLARILGRQSGAPDLPMRVVVLCEAAAAASGPGAPDLREACFLASERAAAPDADASLRARVEALLADALRRDRADPGPALMAARLRYLAGDYPAAVALFRRAEAARPRNVAFLNSLAWTLSEGLGRPEEGLDAVNKAIERIGEDPHFLDTRGVIYTRLGRPGDALADLERAVAEKPDLPTFRYHLALAYLAAGRDDQARDQIDRARDGGLDPDSADPTEREAMRQMLAEP